MAEVKRTIIPIMLLGDGQVGKTSLIARITGNKFDESLLTTIGKSSHTYEVLLHGYNLKMKIWDTAGQERFRSMSVGVIKNVEGLILAYSIENRKSFDNLEIWLKQLNDVKDISKVPIVIVGNKSDLEGQRVIEYDEGKEFADKHNYHFYEVSAKTGQNVKEAFDDIFEQLFQLFEEEITGKKSVSNNLQLNSKKQEKRRRFC